ncbi:MAG: M61 family metallopeptidase [Cyclobacteriaceae bacterium]
MNPPARIIYVYILVFLFTISLAASAPVIQYKLNMPEPQTHYFEVEIHISNDTDSQTDICMPVWAPGSYLIREFPKHVEQFQAIGNDGNPLNAEKINKSTWRVHHLRHKDYVVKYKVYAFELTVRTSFLDADHAYINGSSVFMYIEGHRQQTAVLEITPYEGWKQISTGLTTINGNKWKYHIPDYDILADSPIEIGNHNVYSFDAAGVKHEIAMYGSGNYDIQKITRDLIKIVEECTKVFGENPNENYTFIIHNTDKRGGGLEHLNSTTLQVDRWSYQPEYSYHNFLSLAAHEYFHLWLVKRIRPEVFASFDYSNEQYTTLLWVMEGFVSFYDELILKRAGIIDENEYLRRLVQNINTIENTPGNQIQSVAEASFDTWIKFYRRDENALNSQISYYTKGTVLAAALNLQIIENSRSKYSLDDVLKNLYTQHYKRRSGAISEADVKKSLERFTGSNLTAFFENYVHGTEPINFEKYAEYAGFSLQNLNESLAIPDLGFSYVLNGSQMIVNTVRRNGPAWASGINVYDELISIDAYRFTHDNFAKLIKIKPIGEKVKILVSRAGMMVELECTIERSPERNYTFSKISGLSKSQQLVNAKWLGK